MAPVLYDEKPELGDLIEIDRGSYQHWAVYVGDGFVVHLAPPFEGRGGQSSSVMSVLADRAVVKREELLDVVGTDKWKINNSLDKMYEPRPSHIIVKAAGQLVDQQLPYSILRANCEHFVNELRYGKAESRQVRKAAELVLAAARGRAAVAVGVSAAVSVGVPAEAAAEAAVVVSVVVTAGVAAGVSVAASPVVLVVGIVALAGALFVGSKKSSS